MGLVDEFSDEVPIAADGSLSRFRFAQNDPEPGRHLLDGIEVLAKGRKEAQSCANYLDLFPFSCMPVARQLSQNDEVAGSHFRRRHAENTGFEPTTVVPAIKNLPSDQTDQVQAGDRRGGLAAPIRETHPLLFRLVQRPSPRLTPVVIHVSSMNAECFEFMLLLDIEPCLPLLEDIGAVLLSRVTGLLVANDPMIPE